jgi:hypothetical protein
MPEADFIELIPGALSAEACARLVARFEASGLATPGRTAGGEDRSQKDSRDLSNNPLPEWRDAVQELNDAVARGLVGYLRRYPHLLLAPLGFQCPDGEGGLRRMQAEDLLALGDAELGDMLNAALRPGTINLQHYRADTGGYPSWHCEQVPLDPRAEFLHRALLWTIYLNDDFAEGETEFLYQQRKIAPRTGALLLAPTAFTHTHRGNRPRGGDKYIATSWVLFKRAEHLFQGAATA